ncbi:hypothetical protein ERO13_A09G227900v2 [Gossypium hirsutum]|uniref:Protein PROTON GRADIENT REGULATION 5, chloroplastic n=9 Tax=Gossypium TaxID=3633 RepID=A0A1U8LSL5_GOSHI|nr:protein PROTON GRADIENT REGULATION 5, chloroplastic [Gossypium hirsutum]KAG4185406.1 hypothetical protein ERO13_A09G227900v2 [Gossypium hirsutum]
MKLSSPHKHIRLSNLHPKNISFFIFFKKPSRALPITSHKQRKETPILPLSVREEKLLNKSSMAASTSVSVAGFKGSLGKSSFNGGEDYAMLAAKSAPNVVRIGKPVRAQPMMKNVNEGKGVFAPLVVVTRQIVGKKRFNQLRGKAIALHSQVINEFCKAIGADGKQRQGLIRLAKKNGEKLGFLA